MYFMFFFSWANLPELNVMTMMMMMIFQHKDRQIDRQTDKHPFNGTLSGTTQVSRYQKSKTNLDFTGARYSEWQ